MRKKNQFVLSLVLSFMCASAFYDFFVADAQTTQTPNRARQVASPTPTSIPTPKPTATPKAEEEEEIIKVDTELVNLNVRVVDRNNRSIGTLKQEDFKVYEDNVIQPIEFFTKSEVPTNYSLVIDNSGSLRSQLDKVIEASKIIVNTNRPDDETSVIRFVSSENIRIEQDFTPDKTLLNEALDNLFVEGGQTAIIDAVYLAAEKITEYEKNRDPTDRKRRALILVSDGDDRDSFYKEQQLFNLLRETDVQIYAIGFVGELDKADKADGINLHNYLIYCAKQMCRFMPSALSANSIKKAVLSAKVHRAKQKHCLNEWQTKLAAKFIFLLTSAN